MFFGEAEDRDQLPSPRRLEEARAAGYVPRSRDLCAAIVLLATALLLSAGGGELWGAMLGLWDPVAETASLRTDEFDGTELSRPLLGVSLIAGGALRVACLAAIAANLLQFGWRVTPAAIQPRWLRINPVLAAARWRGGIVPAGMHVLKLLLVSGVVLFSLLCGGERLGELAFAEPNVLGAGIGELATTVVLWLSAGLLVLALADVAWQRWRHRLSLMMSRQEALDEARQNARRDPKPHPRGAFRTGEPNARPAGPELNGH